MPLHPNALPGDPLADPRNFLWLVWSRIGLPDPTPIQYEIMEFLAFGPDPSRARHEVPNSYVIGQAFRGAGKSWLASALTLWELYHAPATNILVVSATAQRANDFSRFCHRLLNEIPELAHLRPSINQRDSAIAWDVGPAPAAHAPSCRSLGIGGQLTGSRADLIIADDCEVITNSATEEMRAKIRAAFAEFVSVLKPRGRIVGLGTPQTERSIYTDLEASGYATRRWPARVPTLDQVNALGPASVAPSLLDRQERGEAGAPTEPLRFPVSVLEERQAVMGRSVFAVQFMLDTSLADGLRYPLRLSDLVVTDFGPAQAPQVVVRSSRDVEDLAVCGIGRDKPRQAAKAEEWAAFDQVVTAVDPAGRGRDETVAMTVGALAGNVYLLEAWATRGEGYSDAALEAICRQAAKYQSNAYVLESNFGDGALTRLLEAASRKVYPALVVEVRQHAQKEARIIDTLEPVMNQHRLVVARSVLEWDATPSVAGQFGEDIPRRLTYQLARITKERGCLGFDDRVDCLAIAVRHLLDSFRLLADEEAERRREDARDDEIRRFLEHSYGPSEESGGWGRLGR